MSDDKVTLTGWDMHDENWVRRQEQLGNGMWLLCFWKISKYPNLPGGWVNVLKNKWVPGLGKYDEVEAFKLEVAGLLEIECLAHEMREKYKE